MLPSEVIQCEKVDPTRVAFSGRPHHRDGKTVRSAAARGGERGGRAEHRGVLGRGSYPVSYDRDPRQAAARVSQPVECVTRRQTGPHVSYGLGVTLRATGPPRTLVDCNERPTLVGDAEDGEAGRGRAAQGQALCFRPHVTVNPKLPKQ